jgi:hypothetical protein
MKLIHSRHVSGFTENPHGHEKGKKLSENPSPERIGILWLVIVVAVSTLICAPFIRTVFGEGGDEGVLLNGAVRILSGKLLYVDFFEFLPPGGFVVTAAWFKLFGVSLVSARTLAIVTIVYVATFTYLACWRASDKPMISAFLTIGWLISSQGFLTQVSHHWFTTLLSMIATFCVLQKGKAKATRLASFTAGAACGMALVITPHRGALAAIAAAACVYGQSGLGGIVMFAIGSAAGPAAALVYLGAHGALLPAYNDVVRFTLGHYAGIQSVPYGFGHATAVTYLPLAAVCFGASWLALDWTKAKSDWALLPSIGFAAAGLIGSFPHPDTLHISLVAPLALPMVAYGVSRSTPWLSRRAGFRYVFVATVGAGIGLCVGPVSLFAWLSSEALRADTVQTPRGKVKLFFSPDLPKLLSRIDQSPPEQSYFFYPAPSLFLFLSGRDQVSKYDLFLPGYTTPQQYRDACRAVVKRATWVVIDENWTKTKNLKRLYPSMADADPPDRQEFEKTLARVFALSERIGRFELRGRIGNADEGACRKIASD